ncbi:MAG: hypothetical protein ACLUFV_04640 [Acutalibacteraceae bacterium]
MHFTKETDTLDGWLIPAAPTSQCWTSGVAQWPADLYLRRPVPRLSSLLEAVAVRGGSPYKAVLTHGWTVDGEGKAIQIARQHRRARGYD